MSSFSKPHLDLTTAPTTTDPPISTLDDPTNTTHRHSDLLTATSPSQKSKNPFSAFYNHPTTRTSLDQVRPHEHPVIASGSTLPVHGNDVDLEAGGPTLFVNGTLLNPTPGISQNNSRFASTATLPHNHSRDESPEGNHGKIIYNYGIHETDSSVWPSKKALEEKALVAKREERKRRHGRFLFMAGLTKKQKLCIQILVGVLVVGAAVGLGVGISKAVGGRVYKGDGAQSQIPQGSR